MIYCLLIIWQILIIFIQWEHNIYSRKNIMIDRFDIDISLRDWKRFYWSNQMETQIAEVFGKQTKIELLSGEIVYLNRLKKKFEEFCNDIIKKFGFNEIEGEEFKKSFRLYPCKTPPGNPKCKWISLTHIHPWDTRAYTTCDVYINTNIIGDEVSYFSVLYHELNHHAYNYKKFIDSNIDDFNWKMRDKVL